MEGVAGIIPCHGKQTLVLQYDVPFQFLICYFYCYVNGICVYTFVLETALSNLASKSFFKCVNYPFSEKRKQQKQRKESLK